VVVWISPDDVLLIRRVRRGRVYYLAPGVAVSAAETPGVAAGRAAHTLLGMDAAVGKVLHAQVFAGVDHFFFAARGLSELDENVELPESDDFELDGELEGTFEIARLQATTLLAYDVRPWALARSVARAAGSTSHRNSSI
jgi:hypothetical protein